MSLQNKWDGGEEYSNSFSVSLNGQNVYAFFKKKCKGKIFHEKLGHKRPGHSKRKAFAYYPKATT